MIRGTILFTTVLMAATLGLASSAQAAGDVEIGGKMSLTAVAAVATTNPDEGDDSTTLLLGGTGAYTTANGRFELGAGLQIIGLFADSDFAIYSPRIEGRVNSNLLGAEENILVYGGAVAGAAFLRSDFLDDEFGNLGGRRLLRRAAKRASQQERSHQHYAG